MSMRSKVRSMAEEFLKSLESLSAVQLMEKKDSIEKELKEFSDVLQTVSGAICKQY